MLIITCLTCLLVGVAFLAAFLPPGLQMAHAQDCEPGTQGTMPSGTPAALPTKGSIVLNEVMLVPLKAPLYCTPTTDLPNTVDGPRIELYNPSPQAIQLPHGGIDSGPNTTIYNFSLASIEAHSFIVIFLSANQTTEISHNALIRLTTSGTILDQIDLPAIPADMSYARASDGGAGWHITQSPTLGISNVPPPVVTPTASNSKPTPTPKIRHTPTPKAKSSSSARGSSSDSASQSKKLTPAATPASRQNIYLQANWKDVHVPTPASHPATMDISTTTPDSKQQAGSANVLPKLMLSGLLLMLTVVIWQCRRLFRKP